MNLLLFALTMGIYVGLVVYAVVLFYGPRGD